jgi:hypothetical protein
MIDGRLSPTLSAYLRIYNARCEKQLQGGHRFRLSLQLVRVVQGVCRRFWRVIFSVKPRQ